MIRFEAKTTMRTCGLFSIEGKGGSDHDRHICLKDEFPYYRLMSEPGFTGKTRVMSSDGDWHLYELKVEDGEGTKAYFDG